MFSDKCQGGGCRNPPMAPTVEGSGFAGAGAPGICPPGQRVNLPTGVAVLEQQHRVFKAVTYFGSRLL